MALRRTTDAASEPVTVAQVKTALNISTTDHDTRIEWLIPACRRLAENETRRALMTQTWTKALDEFPDAIRLDYPPIQSVTSVKYLDPAEVLQALDPSLYTVDSSSEPGYIVPAYGETWPETLCAINAVEVIYIAGYASAALVPAEVKHWIVVMVGFYLENTEAGAEADINTLPFIGSLLNDSRIMGF